MPVATTYNAAADLIERNLAAGRGAKTASSTIAGPIATPSSPTG